MKEMVYNGVKYGHIVFEILAGSHSHGTATEKSDRDIKGVYIQSPDSLFYNGYKPQIDLDADTVYYELGRFLNLCSTANPTMLETLFSPTDCILYKDSLWDYVVEVKQDFLTKKCTHSFSGYAHSQIKKAGGLEKLMNWEDEAKTRKPITDFIHVLGYDYQTYKLFDYFTPVLREELENSALVKSQNGKGIYVLFSDPDKHFNFKGIGKPVSNSLGSVELPKEWFEKYEHDKYELATHIWFDQDGFSRHCKRYRQYQGWLENRNTQRYVDVEGHGQKLDGKNLQHCTRIIEMGLELAKTGQLNVRRPNREYLLDIRTGKYSLQEILNNAEAKITELKEAFKTSVLPNDVDKNTTKTLINNIKKKYLQKL